ncbi:MAG: serine hydrolase [Flavihumibacter sp.]
MLRLLLTVITAVLAFTNANAQPKTDKKLEEKLRGLISDFKGDIGVYVYHAGKNKEAAINADTLFPTASIVKVPILVGLFDKISKGALTYHQPLVYNDSLQYGGSGLMQYFKDSTETDLSVLASLMISYSDNTTSLWSQALAGGGQQINEVLARYGFEKTRVNSRTPGRESNREAYGWGQTTPREMARLLLLIRKQQIVTPAACDKMYRLMTHIYYDDYALSQVPPYVQTASKQGMVDASRSELVMVNAPHGDYVFYIGTKNNADTTWKMNNEAWALTRRISALLWQYFEPHSPWQPPADAARFMED